MIFGYFFILSVILLLFADFFSGININKYLATFCLIAVGALTFLSEININYTLIVNPGVIGILAIALVLYLCMKEGYFSTFLITISLSIIMWGICEVLKISEVWYIKSVACAFLGIVLCKNPFGACFISSMSYILSRAIYLILTLDLELALFSFGIKGDFTGMLISLVLPLIIVSINLKLKRMDNAVNVST